MQYFQSIIATIFLIGCIGQPMYHRQAKPVSTFVALTGAYLTDTYIKKIPDSIEVFIYEYEQEAAYDGYKSLRIYKLDSVDCVDRNSLFYYPDVIIEANGIVFIFYVLGNPHYIQGSRIFSKTSNTNNYDNVLIIGQPATGEILYIDFTTNLCYTPFSKYETFLYEEYNASLWNSMDMMQIPLDAFLKISDSMYCEKYECTIFEKILIHEKSCESLLLDGLMRNY
jgi:hypothetical protein